jgi:hypothetical protein
MALEINEIGIRMRVYGDEPVEPPRLSRSDQGMGVARERAEIVRVCVRQVLRMLEAMGER